MMSVPRVLVVGGGVTAAATCCRLSELLSQSGGCRTTVWDKARAAGGRMSTSRGPNNNNNNSSSGGSGTVASRADLGAQFITLSEHERRQHASLLASWNDAKLLAPLPSDVMGLRATAAADGGAISHLVASAGFRTLVTHLFERCGIEPEFGQRVTEVWPEKDGVRVVTETGRQQVFVVLVLTMPVPQILSLGGALGDSIEKAGLAESLSQVSFSSRFALAAFFDRPRALSCAWSAQFVADDPVFCYVAIDNRRRGQEQENTSVVFHTSTEFGSAHVHQSADEVRELLLRHASQRFPDWPLGGATVKCHKWRFSQVCRPYSSCPGHVVLHQRPLVLAAGDSFAGKSNLVSCLSAASSAAQCVAEHLQSHLRQ